jgi:hypothetical protein
MMSEWQPITEKPPKPTTVIFYSYTSDLSFADQPYRDERVSLGFCDGTNWFWLGTAHLVWEWPDDEGDPNLPTHWMPLPPPPPHDY